MEIIKSITDSIINTYLNNPRLLLSTVIIIVLSIISKIYYPKLRGFMGEYWVKIELSKLSKK